MLGDDEEQVLGDDAWEECGESYEGVVVRSVGSAMNTKIPYFAPSRLLESGLARRKNTTTNGICGMAARGVVAGFG